MKNRTKKKVRAQLVYANSLLASAMLEVRKAKPDDRLVFNLIAGIQIEAELMAHEMDPPEGTKRTTTTHWPKGERVPCTLWQWHELVKRHPCVCLTREFAIVTSLGCEAKHGRGFANTNWLNELKENTDD